MSNKNRRQHTQKNTRFSSRSSSFALFYFYSLLDIFSSRNYGRVGRQIRVGHIMAGDIFKYFSQWEKRVGRMRIVCGKGRVKNCLILPHC